MKRLALVCVLALAACGGDDKPTAPDITGSWQIQIQGQGACQGSMTLTGAAAFLSGNWNCGVVGGSAGGSVSVEGNANLTLASPGYASIVVTGTATRSTISGTASGSGYAAQAFSASR